jgi:hypothetical protein
MNERIYTLAREAGLIAPYGSDREGLRDFDYRMFARLIVQECATIADKDSSQPCASYGELIKQHFGVEE